MKRAQAVEAEKKERKRMRKSLPSSVPSTFSVDESKVRRSITRRQSFSAKRGDNENEQPNAMRQGPTPYWKVRQRHLQATTTVSILHPPHAPMNLQVVQDRGGAISPPQTRSAKKTKLPPRHDAASNGVMLTFSPPNQKLNEQKEKEEAEAKAADR